MRHYYNTLDVSPTATDAEVRAAFHKKALRWHPDRNRHTAESAQAIFIQCQTA
eukprot:CAMPEP_0174899038 /NCGR_PEP_ID=MMETSP0167-20121228/25059_1 /TAXON_ID=38298 /ORGANISM="Rhodella maculata, Strain CCMP736" /LENGTH=52 /DNA_ID=CAMNT_0016139881 /DNA_START=68 /DNA_END=222 /DNA_ORIENTATION=+